MRYFAILSGLRGCYMPDSGSIVAVRTRRELKNAIENEAHSYRDAGFTGASKRAIAATAAAAWRNRGWREVVLPLAPSHARNNYCHGIAISNATRAEYLAQD